MHSMPLHSPSSSRSKRPLPSTQQPSAHAPLLVRTSTIRQNSASSPIDTGSPVSIGSYGQYSSSRAVLELNGPLMSMTENWSDDEIKANRRLVEFRRQQEGSTVHTTFSPVSPEDRDPEGICISCIWWKERREAFVTSVDTIYLLESLVAVHFTVEEKNRIRRNLEGFHPLTVSKSKSSSEDFFSIIMGFPDPKPRNIEKDVKVFPWRVLEQALKKIIGKYSANFPNPTPSQSYATPLAVASTHSSSPNIGQSVYETSAPHVLRSQSDSVMQDSSVHFQTAPNMQYAAWNMQPSYEQYSAMQTSQIGHDMNTMNLNLSTNYDPSQWQLSAGFVGQPQSMQPHGYSNAHLGQQYDDEEESYNYGYDPSSHHHGG